MDFQDRPLQCLDCKNEFIFTAGEQEFYERKGFKEIPKRCKPCRDARKTRRGDSGANANGNGYGGNGYGARRRPAATARRAAATARCSTRPAPPAARPRACRSGRPRAAPFTAATAILRDKGKGSGYGGGY